VFSADGAGQRINCLKQKPRAIFNTAAIFIGAVVGRTVDELFKQITIGTVDLDAVKFLSRGPTGSNLFASRS
jgi:hypothetical protein